MFCEKGVLRTFAKFAGKDLCQSLFFDWKETLVQVFSCQFCEISKSTFSYRIPLVAASVYWWHHSIASFRISTKNVPLLTKEFFSWNFQSCKIFHERVSCVKKKLKGNSIELSIFLKYGLTEVKKAPSQMFDLVLNMPLWAELYI